MDIKLDDKSLQAFVVQSIIANISKGEIDGMFAAGLRSIIDSDYKLKEQLNQLILEELRSYLKTNDSLRARIRELAGEAIEKMLGSDQMHEELIAMLAKAMGNALTGKR
jgi:hypothetical protein